MEGICMHQVNAISALPSTPIYFKSLLHDTTTCFTTVKPFHVQYNNFLTTIHNITTKYEVQRIKSAINNKNCQH